MPNTAANATPESLLRVADVAAALSMSREQVLRLVSAGELPVVQVGGKGHALRIAPADLANMQARWRR